jgi:hypothetical protein
MMMISRTFLFAFFLQSSNAFVVSNPKSSGTALYGLFDGVKEAFAAPALERSALDADRETPIDRWMGWSVVSENDKAQSAAQAGKFQVCSLFSIKIRPLLRVGSENSSI